MLVSAFGVGHLAEEGAGEGEWGGGFGKSGCVGTFIGVAGWMA